MIQILHRCAARMKIKAAILIGMFAAAGCLPVRATPLGLPAGWRAPTASEVDQPWRSDGADRYVRVRADFTGDGLPDEAMLLVREDEQAMGLFVVEARNQLPPVFHRLYEFDDRRFLEAMGIELEKPGVTRVMCSDEADTRCDTPDGKRPFLVRRPSIASFKEGSAGSLFYWDDESGAFEQSWQSD